MVPTRSVAAVVSALAVAACAAQPLPPRTAQQMPQPIGAPVDPAPSSRAATSARARLCAAPFRVGRHRSGSGAALSMTVSNDGGWCGRGLTYDTYAFTGGNIVQMPEHGEARIRHVANRSLVEYRAMPGYTGNDRFSVTMLPGNGVYTFDVTVEP